MFAQLQIYDEVLPDPSVFYKEGAANCNTRCTICHSNFIKDPIDPNYSTTEFLPRLPDGKWTCLDYEGQLLNLDFGAYSVPTTEIVTNSGI